MERTIQVFSVWRARAEQTLHPPPAVCSCPSLVVWRVAWPVHQSSSAGARSPSGLSPARPQPSGRSCSTWTPVGWRWSLSHPWMSWCSGSDLHPGKGKRNKRSTFSNPVSFFLFLAWSIENTSRRLDVLLKLLPLLKKVDRVTATHNMTLSTASAKCKRLELITTLG